MARMNTTDEFSFDNRAVKYSPLNAYWLSVCACIAYDDSKKIKKEVNQWGMDGFNFYSRKGTQCFIASNSRIVILSFRGTQPSKIKDIAADLNIKQTKSYGDV